MKLSDCIGKGKIFEGAILINLETRKDRFVHAKSELGKIDAIDCVEFLPAIKHRFGMVGCSLSHLECVKIAKQRGWKSVLIFEDDIVFKERFNECLEPTIQQLSERNWSIFHFGAMLMNLCNQVSPNLLKVGYNWAAHAVAVHERAYDFILDNYDWSYSETDMSKPWGGHYPFDGFVNKNTYDAGFEIYSAYPCLITQLPNFSDTWGYHRDYKDLIEQSYDIQISREVNVLILSKDRPMQLEALLKSYHKYNTVKQPQDLAKITVLYKCGQPYDGSYDTLKKMYPHVVFQREDSFFNNVRNLIAERRYTLFLVDDVVFHKPFNLNDGCSELSTDPNIFSFSYRLGENTKYSYINNIHFPTPEEYKTGKNIVRVDWTKQNPYIDFGYPFEISASLYRSIDILKMFCKRGQGWDSPNYFELTGTTTVRENVSEFGHLISTYRRSVSVSIPMNRVQNLHLNRCSENPVYSSESLLRHFEAGKEFDLTAINERWCGDSVHVELNLPLKQR